MNGIISCHYVQVEITLLKIWSTLLCVNTSLLISSCLDFLLVLINRSWVLLLIRCLESIHINRIAESCQLAERQLYERYTELYEVQIILVSVEKFIVKKAGNKSLEDRLALEIPCTARSHGTLVKLKIQIHGSYKQLKPFPRGTSQDVIVGIDIQ